MSINFRREGDHIVVSGQTYSHKEAIKSLGCRFVGDRKVWQVAYSESVFLKIQELCESFGGGELQQKDQATAKGGAQEGVLPESIARRANPIPARELKLSSSTSKIPNSVLASSTNHDGITVSALMNRVSNVIAREFSAPIWVIGEIQNLQNRGNAIYLSLAEGVDGRNQAATVTASATIWSNSFRMMEQRHGKQQLQDILADGMQVRCLVQVTFYKGRGNLSLAINDIDVSFTKGALALAREKLLKELKVKGLAELNKSLTLTDFPFKVGLICAEGSRAETDLKHQLISSGFSGELLYVPAAAQGEKVISEVPAAIRTLIDQHCDLIILTRGGGSAADLRWFDAPEVAYAVCQSSIPIIAAIGHHDDESVAELVAFQRCKTPTAAAEFVASRFLATRKKIENMAESLASNLNKQVILYTERQSQLVERLQLSSQNSLTRLETQTLNLTHQLERNFQQKIQTQQLSFNKLSESITLAANKAIHAYDQKISQLEKSIIAIDPSPWLKQGWTQLFQGKKQLKSTQIIDLKQNITARLIDGNLKLRVESIEHTEKKD